MFHLSLHTHVNTVKNGYCVGVGANQSHSWKNKAFFTCTAGRIKPFSHAQNVKQPHKKCNMS